MHELLIIRFAFMKFNTKMIIEFNGLPVVYCTASNPMIITPGIYEDPPYDFSNLSFFTNNALKLDHREKVILQNLLTAHDITKITLI